ncbi:hypothetical protein ES703_06209 [subsurface metagenome]
MASAGPPQPRRPRLTDINLIPRKEVRPPISLFGVTVALLIVLLIYAVFPFAYLAQEYDWPDVPNLYGLWDEQRDDIDDLENTLDDAEAELARLQSLFPEALALIDQINELESLLSVMGGDYQILSQSAVIWSEVLEVIHEVAPAGVTITSIIEGSSLDIEGTAVSGDDVTSFAMALSNTGLFGEVGPTDIEYEPTEDGVEPAEIVLDDGEDAWVGLPSASTVVDDCEDEWEGRWGAPPTVVEDCEDAWSVPIPDPGVDTFQDLGDYKEGNASTRQEIDPGFSTGLIAYENFAALDLSGATHIELWIKSGLPRNAGDLKLLLDDNNNCPSPLETLTIPALIANTWTKVSVALTSLPADRTAILSVGLSASVDPGQCKIWVDDVKAVIPEVTCSFDTTDKMAGSASAKQVIADGFDTGLITYEDLDTVAPPPPLNLSARSQVTFWIKSSEDRVAGDLQLLLDDSPGCGSPLEGLDLPALAEDVWTSVTLTLANPSNLTAIQSVGLYATVDPGACTIWLDDVKAETPGVICSADFWDFKEGEASAKMEVGASFFTPPAPIPPPPPPWNIIAYEVITSPKDLSSYEAITFWIKSDESTTFGDLQLLLDDNSGCETPWETINIPPLTKDIWTRVSLSFSDPEKLTAIISVGLKATVADIDGSIIWMDDVKVSELTGAGDYTFTITVSLIGGSQ